MIRRIGVRQHQIKRLNRGLPNSPGQDHPQKAPKFIAQTQASAGDGLTTDLPPIRGQRRQRDHNIHVHDLDATVQAHAAANDRKGHVNAGTTPKWTGTHIRYNASRSLREVGGVTSDTGKTYGDKASGADVEAVAHGSKRSGILPCNAEQTLSPENHHPPGTPVEILSLTQPGHTTGVESSASEASTDVAEKDDASTTYPRPWARFLTNEPGRSAIQRLDAEIRAYGEFLKPTPREQLATQQLVEEISSVIWRVLPAGVIISGGTRRWGVAEPLGSMSFSVVSEAQAAALQDRKSPSHPAVRAVRKHDKEELAQAFSTHPRFSSSFRHAVIDYMDSSFDLEAGDLGFQDVETELQVKLRCGGPSRGDNQICLLLEETPQARPLFHILERMLNDRKLLRRSHGGVGRYTLLVMIVAAIRLSKVRFHRDELAQQLLHVLQFWSTADLSTQGFAADPPKVFEKYRKPTRELKSVESVHSIEDEQTVHWEQDYKSDCYLAGIEVIAGDNWAAAHGVGKYVKGDHLRHLLCLQDPAFPERDLGRYSHRIDAVKAVFSEALRKTRGRIESWNLQGREAGRSRPSADVFLLDHLAHLDSPYYVAQRLKLSRSYRSPRTGA